MYFSAGDEAAIVSEAPEDGKDGKEDDGQDQGGRDSTYQYLFVNHCADTSWAPLLHSQNPLPDNLQALYTVSMG